MPTPALPMTDEEGREEERSAGEMTTDDLTKDLTDHEA
jgi:hypothetical protein